MTPPQPLSSAAAADGTYPALPRANEFFAHPVPPLRRLPCSCVETLATTHSPVSVTGDSIHTHQRLLGFPTPSAEKKNLRFLALRLNLAWVTSTQSGPIHRHTIIARLTFSFNNGVLHEFRSRYSSNIHHSDVFFFLISKLTQLKTSVIFSSEKCC